MSRFFSNKFAGLTPYVPGEQPTDQQYIKLNTNESPFIPCEGVKTALCSEVEKLQLYPDPTYHDLVLAAADHFGLSENEILFGNGSDEILNFAFMAFCDDDSPAVFPDITYGFYPVFAAVNHLPYREIPLKDDLSVDSVDYARCGGTVFLANPNAPTGIALTVPDIEGILKSNPEHVVVIDEAYVDFGAESCVPLIRRYDNLLVVQTFSKSRSFAGGRLGFAMGCPALIADLNTIKYSTNPYNINRLTAAAGLAIFENDEIVQENCRKIMAVREKTALALKAMGFSMPDSLTNFLFVRHPKLPGDTLYRALRERGILIRYFGKPPIEDFSRITIGTEAQMETLTETIRSILQTTEGRE